jgi:siroheme synthase (precorrin-2 oxidase/ferrochelatase)
MYLPLSFKSDFSCLIIGEGEVAARRLEVLGNLHCNIAIMAPQVSCEPLLFNIGRSGKIACRGRIQRSHEL